MVNNFQSTDVGDMTQDASYAMSARVSDILNQTTTAYSTVVYNFFTGGDLSYLGSRSLVAANDETTNIGKLLSAGQFVAPTTVYTLLDLSTLFKQADLILVAARNGISDGLALEEATCRSPFRVFKRLYHQRSA